ncbi:hypothetical protein [Micromonospora sp. U21]|uniref:hypothetical protein n=1 Tax=Micromonospora sp. U21 TaxID=2824899 RepID=UPI001FFC4570|nr:hypothetical protein [Micromonospora sp. U21]
MLRSTVYPGVTTLTEKLPATASSRATPATSTCSPICWTAATTWWPGRNEDFNLSTAESTSVLELAELIWHKIKGSDVPFRYVCDEPFRYDVQKRVPDVTKAREVLGFTATTSLDVMLDEVVPWVARAVAEGRL